MRLTSFHIQGYILAATATVLSIFFLDRPIATFTYEHQLRNPVFEWMTWPPDILYLLIAFWLVACIKRDWRLRFGQTVQNVLLALALAWGVRITAKFAFGRTWPDTWIDNNPSWLQNGIEGFYPFAESTAYGSFPSGHTLVTFAMAAVLWQTLPRWRWLWALFCLSVVVGMLGQYYHYLGDLLAGALLGTLCGQLAMAIMARVQTIIQSRRLNNCMNISEKQKQQAD